MTKLAYLENVITSNTSETVKEPIGLNVSRLFYRTLTSQEVEHKYAELVQQLERRLKM